MDGQAIDDLPVFKDWGGVQVQEVLREKTDEGKIPYSMSRVRVAPGCESPLHHLEGKTETYYIAAGKGEVNNGKDAPKQFTAPHAFLFGEGERQSIRNTGDTTIEVLCIVYPPWDAKSQVMG